MMDILLAMAGNQGDGLDVKVSTDVQDIGSGREILFVVDYDQAIEGMTLYWSIGGDIEDSFITSELTGSFMPEADTAGAHPIRINTQYRGDLNITKTLTLRVHQGGPDGAILAESSVVSVIYSSAPIGQQLYNNPGTYTFEVPADVHSLCAVAIGGGMGGSAARSGSGGAGGDLRWYNDIAVTPGETLTVVVGAGGYCSNDFPERIGAASQIRREDTVILSAKGGGQSASDSTAFTLTRVWEDGEYHWTYPSNPPFIGGGNGGDGAEGGNNQGPGAGGGTGGYLGHGGQGANRQQRFYNRYANETYYGGQPGNEDSGAAGGGATYDVESSNSHHATPGGGTGLLGRGRTGRGGVPGDASMGGFGGSGGTDSTWLDVGVFGGGGRGTSSVESFVQGAVDGGNGGVRLIWGYGRRFPNNGTGNL